MVHFIRRLRLKTIMALLIFCVLSIAIVFAEAEVKEIRIADSKGDWGYPNPYGHYPRGPGFIRMSWVFDTLIWKNDKGYIPALAKSWSYDPESLKFIFELQEGITWHDGTPFSPEDVVFTVNYYKNIPITGFPWRILKGLKPLARTALQ